MLDDDNISDGHIASCINDAAEAGDQAGVELGALLMQMTKTQRRKVCKQASRIHYTHG